MVWPWSELGLPGPAGMEEIRHAYAQQLKQVHPEEDPEGFQRLHQAYLAARRLAQTAARRCAGAPAGPEQPFGGADDALDFDELLSQAPEEAPEPQAPEEESWDFEALFSQGQQEAEPEQAGSEEQNAWVPPSYTPHRQSRLKFFLKAAILVGFLCFVAQLANIPALLSRLAPSKVAETQRWLEDTYQVELVSSPQNENREEDRFLYWREDDPDVKFQAIRDGEGEYRTNYTSAMFFWQMRAFSQQWPDYPLWFDQEMTDREGEGAQGGSPPYLFLFQVPLEGAEEFLTDLGAQLEQLADTDWYAIQQPEYIFALAHGEAILCSYDSTAQEMPTGEELVSLYQDGLYSPLLQDLLFQQDVALWDFPEKETLVWADMGEGWVKEDYGWWISCRGVDREGKDQTMYYFLREDYSALYCFPSEVLDHPYDMITLSCAETRTMPCGRTVEIYRIL